MKIVKLTEAQERAMIEYRDQWLTWGRCCDPSDRKAAEVVWAEMYAAMALPPPRVLWWDGPATSTIAAALLWDNLGDNLRDNLWANLGANLGDNLRDNLWANLGANLRDNLLDNLRENLGDNLAANLGANLRDNLWANLGANLRENLRDNLGENLGANLPWFWGQHEVAWMAFYAWPDAALRPMHTALQRRHLEWWLTLARSTGWWHPYRGVVMACERPSRQAVNALGQLHHDSAPALLCRDGWSVYALNNVRVPAWLVETPAAELDPLLFAKQDNVEVRREFVRKIGVERLCAKLGTKVLDKQGDYELHLVDLKGATGPWPYLKMRNPSIGVYHMEAVTKECDTVEKALNFRNGGPHQHLQPIT